MYRAACAAVGSVGLVSLSRNQRRPAPELPWIANVPNAIDPDRYDVPREPGDALAFLGRMSPDKGAHHAIEVARRTGRPLRIAAKCQEPAERAYFEQAIRPQLSSEIEYLGELGHDDKVELLRTSHCLVFPIDWEEPFGLVMIEAMACGTPVVATRRGSVPEVVRDGTTGIVVDAVEEMPAAVERIGALDPDTLRAEVRRRFSTERMVEGYLRAVCGGRRRGGRCPTMARPDRLTAPGRDGSGGRRIARERRSEEPIDLGPGRAPVEPTDDPRAVDEHQSRHVVDVQVGREVGALVDVDLDHAQHPLPADATPGDQARHPPRRARPSTREEQQQRSIVDRARRLVPGDLRHEASVPAPGVPKTSTRCVFVAAARG